LKFPGTVTILLFAVFTGLLQFLIRLKLPVGWSMSFTNFQFPFFVQYVFLFMLGLIASRNNWTENINYRLGKRWFILSQVIIFIGFPLLFIVGGATTSGAEPFMGGFTLQSLGYSLWEQITGISLMIGLTGIFREKANHQGIVAKALSASAFGVFVFHAPLIVGLSVAFSGWQIFPVLKLILLAVPALVLCFGFSLLVKKIPGVNKVL
jgi:MFS family permease